MREVLRFCIIAATINTTFCFGQTYTDPNIPKPTSGYGADGSHTVVIDSFPNPNFAGKYINVYHPGDISTKVPTIFFSHAFGGNDPQGVIGLLKFIAMKGYAVVFVPYKTVAQMSDRYENLLQGFRLAARKYTSIIDTSKVGFSGWSFGGGASFASAYKCFTENNWGKDGRFIYTLAPWYSFNINQSELQSFPSDTKFLTEIFDGDTINDHRMAVDIFHNINIAGSEKDFILLKGDTISGYIYEAGHSVPNSNTLNALDYYGIFRLLDALCDYTFNGSTAGKDVALGNGSTAQVTMPSGLKKLVESENPSPLYPQTKYMYPCDSSQNPRLAYCEGIPVTSVSVSPGTATIETDNTLQLTATVLPATTTNKTVTWTSSDEAVATVSNSGLITAVAPGSVTITATSNSDAAMLATCAVTVSAPIEMHGHAGNSYSLYPNPAQTDIRVKNIDGSQMIRVYSQSGVMMIETRSDKINISSWPSGIYIVIINDMINSVQLKLEVVH